MIDSTVSNANRFPAKIQMGILEEYEPPIFIRENISGMFHDNDAYMSHSRRIKERSNRLHSEIPLVIGTPACKRSGKRNVEMNSDPNSTFCVCGGVDGKVDTVRHVKGSFNVQGEINL